MKLFKRWKERRDAKRKALVTRITNVVGAVWEHLEEDQRKYNEREAYLKSKYRSNLR